MDNEILFKLLVPTNIGFFAFVFLIAYLYERRFKYMGLVSLAYFSGVIASLLDVIPPHSRVPAVDAADFANIFFILIGILITYAWANRYQYPVPKRFLGLGFLAACACQIYAGVITYNFPLQEIMANIWAAVFLFTAVYIINKQGKRPIERLLVYTTAAIAISYIIRVTGVFLTLAYSPEDELIALHNTIQLFASAFTANFGAVTIIILGGFDLIKSYRVESSTDPLTRLYNRRGIEAKVQELIEGNDDVFEGHTILAVDVDHFKTINDKDGHHTGDKVLQKIGDLLNEQTSSLGFAARIGGEEFAIILNPEHQQSAQIISENIRISVANMSQMHNNIPNFTVSIGFAVARQDERYLDTYRRADSALYAAKNNGRNRVEACTDEAQPKLALIA